jgi:hypothetical protein
MEGGKFDFASVASMASKLEDGMSKASELSDQATKGLESAQKVADQATKTVSEVSDKTNELVATGQNLVEQAKTIPGVTEGLDLLEAQQNKDKKEDEQVDKKEDVKEDKKEEPESKEEEGEDKEEGEEGEKGEEEDEDEEESVVDDNSLVSEEEDGESVDEGEEDEEGGESEQQEYNDQSDTCVLQKGTILYYSTPKMSTMSKKNISFKEPISKFVTSLDTSKMNIKMCTEEYSSATIHAFMVNIPISNIKITTGQKFEKEDKELLEKKQLDKKYCNDRFRGFMFRHENEISKIIPNQVKTGGGTLVLNPGDSLTVQAPDNEEQSCTYWLCDPSENLTYLWSTQCIGYNRLSKPLAYES